MRQKEPEKAAIEEDEIEEEIEASPEPDDPLPEELKNFLSILKGMQTWESFFPASLSDEISKLQQYFPCISHLIEAESRPHQLNMCMALSGLTEALKQNIDRAKLTEEEARELRSFTAIGDRFFDSMEEAGLITPKLLEYRSTIQTILTDALLKPRWRTSVIAPSLDKRFTKCFRNNLHFSLTLPALQMITAMTRHSMPNFNFSSLRI